MNKWMGKLRPFLNDYITPHGEQCVEKILESLIAEEYEKGFKDGQSDGRVDPTAFPHDWDREE